jgi:DNA polymerase-3 subunit gamma/tau
MRMKIYIVDEAHMLTKEGANAFLKTLEEPPAHAVFILATTEPEKLPVTILSRCQRYAFRRIAVPVMIEKMKEVALGEKIAIDDEALKAIAYRADGGLRDALTMLEQLAAFSAGQTATTGTLDLAFGATGREFAATLMDAIVAGDATAALGAVEEASEAGADLTVLTRSLIAGFRHLLVAKVDAALLATDLAPEDAQRAVRQAAGMSQAVLLRALRIFGEALSLGRSGGNARLELETALLRFVMSAEDPTLDTLGARLSVLEERLSAAPVPPPAAAAVQPPVEKPAEFPRPRDASPPAEPRDESQPAQARDASPLSLQKVKAAWQSIRSKIESERQPLRAPLSRAAIEALESNAIVLRLPDTWSAESLRGHTKIIEAAIADVLGVPLKVTLRVDSNPGRSKSPAQVGVTEARPVSEADDPDALFDYANERIR